MLSTQACLLRIKARCTTARCCKGYQARPLRDFQQYKRERCRDLALASSLVSSCSRSSGLNFFLSPPWLIVEFLGAAYREWVTPNRLTGARDWGNETSSVRAQEGNYYLTQRTTCVRGFVRTALYNLERKVLCLVWMAVLSPPFLIASSLKINSWKRSLTVHCTCWLKVVWAALCASLGLLSVTQPGFW